MADIKFWDGMNSTTVTQDKILMVGDPDEPNTAKKIEVGDLVPYIKNQIITDKNVVKALNGLSGGLEITAGDNIKITAGEGKINISAEGGNTVATGTTVYKETSTTPTGRTVSIPDITSISDLRGKITYIESAAGGVGGSTVTSLTVNGYEAGPLRFIDENGAITINPKNGWVKKGDVYQILYNGQYFVVQNPQVPTATTSYNGIVKLNDTLTSTSTTEALTANQGKILHDLIKNQTGGAGTSGFTYQTYTVPVALGLWDNSSTTPWQNAITIFEQQMKVATSSDIFIAQIAPSDMPYPIQGIKDMYIGIEAFPMTLTNYMSIMCVPTFGIPGEIFNTVPASLKDSFRVMGYGDDFGLNGNTIVMKWSSDESFYCPFERVGFTLTGILK